MLLVCRTSPANSNGTLFLLRDVRDTNGEITVNYSYAGRTDLTGGLKDTLNVYVPKKDYTRVRFVENGQLVQVLDLRGGRWAVPPALPPDE
jgi:nitrogen fixation protein